MPGLPVIVSAIVALGRNMSREFIDNFKQVDLGEQKHLSLIMGPDRKGVGETDYVGWIGASPNPEFWAKGDEIPVANMDGFVGTIVHKAFGIKIPYGRDDVIFERTGSLLEMVRDTANKWKMLDARVLKEFSTGTVDASLYPSVPNAFDGAAFFNATDGNSANRFSVSGGNIVTGLDFDSAAGCLSAIIKIINRASSFLDTDGQPKWNGEQLQQIVLVVPQAYAEFFQKALNQPITSSEDVGSHGVAGVSNFIKTMGIEIDLYITPRYTAKEIYVYFPRVKRSFGRSLVLAPTTYESTMASGSDVALATKQQSWQSDMLAGHYINLPFGAVKGTT